MHKRPTDQTTPSLVATWTAISKVIDLPKESAESKRRLPLLS